MEGGLAISCPGFQNNVAQPRFVDPIWITVTLQAKPRVPTVTLPALSHQRAVQSGSCVKLHAGFRGPNGHLPAAGWILHARRRSKGGMLWRPDKIKIPMIFPKTRQGVTDAPGPPAIIRTPLHR